MDDGLRCRDLVGKIMRRAGDVDVIGVLGGREPWLLRALIELFAGECSLHLLSYAVFCLWIVSL